MLLPDGGLGGGLGAAGCSGSLRVCSGSQSSNSRLTAGEDTSTPNPSHAVEKPLFGQDLRGISNIWEISLFPLTTRSILSPAPTESGQRLSQSGCFYGLAALSLCSSNYIVYFGNKNVLFDDIGEESSLAFLSRDGERQVIKGRLQ